MVDDIVENSKAPILVVEDEPEIRELISILLRRQGYSVDSCATVQEAQSKLENPLSGKEYGLIILDWMLPGMNGVEWMKRMTLSRRPPILMVTAKTEPQDIVQGLESGADDYVTKPFEASVLSARVKALLRRYFLNSQGKSLMSPLVKGAFPVVQDEELIQVGQLSINLVTYEVRCGEEHLHLTPSEFKIISEMGKSLGRVLTRDHLVRVVQGDGISVTGRTIDTHVFGLRKKMGLCADCIETIRGVGYRLRLEL